MDNITFLIIAGLIAVALWAWVLHSIIRNASQSEQRNKLLQVQIRMLAELLKINGVSQERIKEIRDLNTNYFA